MHHADAHPPPPHTHKHRTHTHTPAHRRQPTTRPTLRVRTSCRLVSFFLILPVVPEAAAPPATFLPKPTPPAAADTTTEAAERGWWCGSTAAGRRWLAPPRADVLRAKGCVAAIARLGGVGGLRCCWAGGEPAGTVQAALRHSHKRAEIRLPGRRCVVLCRVVANGSARAFAMGVSAAAAGALHVCVPAVGNKQAAHTKASLFASHTGRNANTFSQAAIPFTSQSSIQAQPAAAPLHPPPPAPV